MDPKHQNDNPTFIALKSYPTQKDKQSDPNSVSLNTLVGMALALQSQDEHSKALEIWKQIRDLDSDSRPSYIQAANCHIILKEFKKAENLFLLAKAKWPEASEPVMGLARIIYGKHNYLEAVKLFQTVIDKFPELKEAYYLRTQCYIRLGKELKAQKSIENALSKWPFDTRFQSKLKELRKNLPKILVDEELQQLRVQTSSVNSVVEFESAMNLWRGAVEKHPTDSRFQEGIARTLQRSNQLNKALKYWRDISQKFPSKVNAFVQIGNIYATLSEYSKAENSFEFVRSVWPNEPKALAGLANIAQMKRLYSESLELWQKASLLDPKNINYQRRVAVGFHNVGQISKSLELFRSMQTKWPTKVDGFIGEAQLYQKRKEWEQAIQLWDVIIERFPNEVEAYIQKGRALCEVGSFKLAEQVFVEAMSKWPDNRSTAENYAFVTQKQEDWNETLNRISNAEIRFPLDLNIKIRKIRVLLSLNQFDEAISAYERMVDYYGNWRFSILKCEIYAAQGKFDEAILEVNKLIAIYPENVQLIQRKASLLHRTRVDTPKAIVELESLLSKTDNDYKILEQLAYMFVSVGDFDKAKKYIDDIQSDFEFDPSVLELKAWKESLEDNISSAGNRWESILDKTYYRSIHSNITLKRIDQNDITSITSDDIILFATIQNEMLRLPWFISYYRDLGVTRFLIADNNSSDGTTEFLKQQPDVHIFWTDDNYAHSGCGMRWVNELVNVYGAQNWCLFAVPDEALIYPNIEKYKLRHFLDYLEKYEFDAVRAFMLDMYAENTQLQKSYASGDDLVQACPYFDNNISFYDSVRAPFKRIYGGFRSRMFAESEGLTKTPIIRGGRGIKFLHSSHVVTPCRIANVTAVFLHYKFVGDVLKQVNEAAFSKTRYKSGRRYVKYANVLEGMSEDYSYINPLSERFLDSKQLMDLGLIDDLEESWVTHI